MKKMDLSKLHPMDSSVKQIILHVGLPKTATTSLQSTLKENSDLIMQSGILYPDSIFENHGFLMKLLTEENPQYYFFNVLNNRSFSDVCSIATEMHQTLAEELHKKKPTTLILSGEAMFNAKPYQIERLEEWLKLIAKKAKVKVIFCVRSPIGFYTSYIQESIRSFGLGSRAYKFNKRLYQNTIKNYKKVFSRSSVRVFSFEEAATHEKGPVGYFLEFVGIKKILPKISEITVQNESMKREAAKIIEFINNKKEIVNPKTHRMNLNRYPGDTKEIATVGEQKFYLPESFQKKILIEMKPEIKWLYRWHRIDYRTQEVSAFIEKPSLSMKALDDLLKVCDKLNYFVASWLIEYIEVKMAEKDITEGAQEKALDVIQAARRRMEKLSKG